MRGVVVGFQGIWPICRIADGREVQCDFLMGDHWEVGHVVFIQDVSWPEMGDRDHFLITEEWSS